MRTPCPTAPIDHPSQLLCNHCRTSPQVLPSMASPPEDLQQRAAALVQQLRSGSDSQRGAAANELWRMAQEAPGADAAVAAGAVEALLLLLRSPAHTSGGGDAGSGSSVSPECAALAALDNLLVRCPASNDLMAAAGGIELCVRLVQQRPGSLAQAYALSALCGTSSYHAGNTATIAAAGIIPAVVLALGSSDLWAQSNAACLLANLMHSIDCIQTARGAGAILALLRCLKTPQPSTTPSSRWATWPLTRHAWMPSLRGCRL